MNSRPAQDASGLELNDLASERRLFPSQVTMAVVESDDSAADDQEHPNGTAYNCYRFTAFDDWP